MLNTKESNFISTVIYISNKNLFEEITLFLDTLTEFLTEKFHKYEFIVVNDQYKDIRLVKDYLKNKHLAGKVTVINLSRYHGVELAMSAGVDLAIGDYVFEFDKIRSNYAIALLDDVYCKCLQGNDIVSVTAQARMHWFSKFFYYIYNHSQIYQHGKQKSEMFRLVSRRAINRIKSMALSTPYRKIQYAQCGLPRTDIEYKDNNKNINFQTGTNEVHMKIDLAIDTLILFTNFVAKMIMAISIFFLFFSFAVGIYASVCYFGINKPVEGWTPIMGFLSVAFSGIFAILTIIIKYLSLIIRMIFVKQEYLVESVEKI